MATLRHVASLTGLALITACYRQEPDLYSTFPEPTEVAGPPGGEMDREWQTGYVDDNAPTAAPADVDPSAHPQASGDLVASCTDGEIDATLTPYGEWIYIEGYGEVWRPYTTVVGVDFTPYETCGTWVWTEWGWTFACEWDWGWLPFHYGRWGWFDDYWAWVPGYEWSPAWVEWRSGGGYVGWRPLAPTVRDHRTGTKGPIVRDHRGPRIRDHRGRVASAKDWQWRFAAERDLGRARIRSHLFKGLAEGLRVTSVVSRPTVRPTVQPVKVASIMRARLALGSRVVRDNRVAPVRGHARVEAGPVRAGDIGSRWRDRERRPSFDRSSGASVYQPTWQQPHAPRPSFGAAQPAAAPPPAQEFTPTTPPPEPVLDPSVRPDRHTSAATPPVDTAPPTRAPDRIAPPQPPVIQPPTRAPDRIAPPQPPVIQPPTRAPDRVAPPRSPSYQPPARAPERYTPPPVYQPPARAPERYTPPPSYSPPSRASSPLYSPPARSYSPPARSYSPPSRSYSPPPASAARSHRR